MPNSLVKSEDPDLWYVFVRNYWKVIQSLWPVEFTDKTNFKLQTLACQLALAQFGQLVFRKALPTQETTENLIRAAFHNDPTRMDWRVQGPLRLATGKGGKRQVFDELEKQFLSQP